jgi:hypothetical protein
MYRYVCMEVYMNTCTTNLAYEDVHVYPCVQTNYMLSIYYYVYVHTYTYDYACKLSGV